MEAKVEPSEEDDRSMPALCRHCKNFLAEMWRSFIIVSGSKSPSTKTCRSLSTSGGEYDGFIRRLASISPSSDPGRQLMRKGASTLEGPMYDEEPYCSGIGVCSGSEGSDSFGGDDSVGGF
jgi:hypothetical protein